MFNSNEVFSLTLLVLSPESKKILVKKGEVPAKVEDEADSVLSSDNPEEAELLDRVLSQIPVFAEAEPGSEETITKTLEELQDAYGISFEEAEEVVGADLDSDSEQGESQEHQELVMRNAPEEISMTEPGEVSEDMYEMYHNLFTEPSDFIEEELATKKSNYFPTLSEDEIIAEVDEQSAESISEGVEHKVLALVRHAIQAGGRLYATQLNEIFNASNIKDPDSRVNILKFILGTGEASLGVDPAKEPYIDKVVPMEERPAPDVARTVLYSLINGPQLH